MRAIINPRECTSRIQCIHKIHIASTGGPWGHRVTSYYPEDAHGLSPREVTERLFPASRETSAGRTVRDHTEHQSGLLPELRSYFRISL